MNLFQAAVLGIVQGVAEFLPISSSGHLVLVQEYLGITQETMAFDVFLHFATLLAVIIYFRSDLLKLSKKMMLAIVVASIPAGFAGIFLEDYITSAFGSLLFVGFALLVTGTFNCISEYKLKRQIEKKTEVKTVINNKMAFVIGLLQAFAILPGISRSGSTVFAGVVQNIDRKLAFKFSFIMSIPVIFGANLLHVSRAISGNGFSSELNVLFVGGVLAFVSGFASLKLLELMMVKAKMTYFGIYCFVVGLLVIGLSLF